MYAKLFASMYQGTLRGRSDEILVFTNLLAHADQHGHVDKHWQAIADETGLPRDRVERAILNLESPDPESRSPKMDGRRLIRIDEHRAWGWLIVNHGKYRTIRNEEDRREQNRESQRRWRERKHDSNPRKQNKPRKPPSAHTDTDTDTDTEAVAKATATAAQEPDHDKPIKLPPDWRPATACRDYAADKGLDPDTTADAFTDYFCQGRGRNEKRTGAGWEKRWRVWCNTDADRRPANGQGVRSARRESELEAFARGAALAAARMGGDEPV